MVLKAYQEKLAKLTFGEMADIENGMIKVKECLSPNSNSVSKLQTVWEEVWEDILRERSLLLLDMKQMIDSDEGEPNVMRPTKI